MPTIFSLGSPGRCQSVPDEVMDAQMGHVSPAVGKRYSHIRREAMKRAAAALEPAEAVRQILINTPEADKNATIQ
jgi:hypothetical protein